MQEIRGPVDQTLVETDGDSASRPETTSDATSIDRGRSRRARPWYVVKKLAAVPAGDVPVHPRRAVDEGRRRGRRPADRGQFPFANGVSTLGAGWLGAYFVLSGSPVAATAISLFGAGTLTKLQAFTMLSGSRLGASFIVLLTGFLYATKQAKVRCRRRSRATSARRSDSIGIGIQAMTMTAIVYLPGMLIGYAIIRAGLLDGFDLHASGKLEASLGTLWGPIVDFVSATCPRGRCS